MYETTERYQIEEADGVLYLVMPYRKQWYQILSLTMGILASGCILLPVMIIFYTSGMAYTLYKENPVILIFLSMMIFVLLIFSYIETIWQLTGREIITIADDFIRLRHQIHGFGVENKLPAAIISGIYLSRQNDLLHTLWTRRSSAFWSYKRGRISINCGRTFLGEAQTYRFGSILDEESSFHIVGIIQKRFPQYTNQPNDKT
jgi:hypothetical protein